MLSACLLRIGLADAQDLADAVGQGGVEHLLTVIDEQAALRLKGMARLQSRPESCRFFGGGEGVRTEDVIEVRADAGDVELEGEAVVVSVGDQPALTAAGGDGLEKSQGLRADTDAGAFSLFQGDEIEAELSAPEIDAVPAETAALSMVSSFQFGLCLRKIEAMRLRPALRYELAPEVVVEVEVEQGAVHVEHDEVDATPVDEHDA